MKRIWLIVFALSLCGVTAFGQQGPYTNRPNNIPAGAGKISSPGTENQAKIGPGTPLGAPPSAPTVATGGAGALTGTYKYCYAESDGVGESTCSPVGTYVAAGEQIQVTLPLPRRGVSQRYLYRQNQGAGLYRLVHPMGSGYFQNIWIDNVADATVAAAAAAKTVDSSALYNLEVNKSVKFFRTHPDQGGNPADVTLLTSDPATSGAYALDAYGPIFARTYQGNAFQSAITGLHSGNHFKAFYQGDVDDGVAPTGVFILQAGGGVSWTPVVPTINGGGLSSSITFNALNSSGTSAWVFGETGAGSANYYQAGVASIFSTGYTGASFTAAFYGANSNTGSTGQNYGLYTNVSGTAAQAIGVMGMAQGATANIGVYGNATGLTPAAATFSTTSVGGAFDNGTGTGDMIEALKNGTVVFRVKDTGNVDVTGLNANSSTTFTVNTNSKGAYKIMANGNTDIQIGSTNNVPVKYLVNGSVYGTQLATGYWGLGASTTPVSTVHSFGSIAGKVNPQSGTSYTLADSDFLVTFSNAGAVTVTMLASDATRTGRMHKFCNLGAGTVTLTRAGSDTFVGNASVSATTIALATGKSCDCTSDGAGHWIVLVY